MKTCKTCGKETDMPFHTCSKLVKLSTPKQKLAVLAEMDGWRNCRDGYGDEIRYAGTESETCVTLPLPNYTHSYDAIIPLIQKQDDATRQKVRAILDTFAYVFDPSASELCDALLKAKGYEL